MLIASWLCASAWAASAQGGDAEEIELRLERLRERIGAMVSELERDRDRRGAELERLATAERELDRIGRALRESRAVLDGLEDRIEAREAHAAELRSEIRRLEQHLAEQLRAAYRLGAHSRLRTLLGEEDPRRINRLMAWHGYLGRARIEALAELGSRLEELADVEADLAARAAELARQVRAQEARRAEQDQARRERARAVAELESRILEGESELARLRADAAELEALLEQLADALADIPPDIEAPSIETLRGRLPRPAAGPVRAGFGERRSGEVRWSGWLIGAEPGTEVQAIAHGRVAYADWLRGYGMLLIIEHGEGFMSLYGHNETLLAEVGDWVRPGQVVALAGAGAGDATGGVYFELRLEGRPLDPAAWLAR